jgi:hypothetical protein
MTFDNPVFSSVYVWQISLTRVTSMEPDVRSLRCVTEAIVCALSDVATIAASP